MCASAADWMGSPSVARLTLAGRDSCWSCADPSAAMGAGSVGTSKARGAMTFCLLEDGFFVDDRSCAMSSSRKCSAVT